MYDISVLKYIGGLTTSVCKKAASQYHLPLEMFKRSDSLPFLLIETSCQK